MNKSTMLFIGKIVTILVIGAALVHFGRSIGEASARQRFEKETYLLSAFNAVPLYASYAEMSERIGDGKVAQAKCTANLYASSYLRDIRQCLGQRTCSDFILDGVKKTAPELLDAGTQKFTYFESGERCSYDNPDKSK